MIPVIRPDSAYAIPSVSAPSGTTGASQGKAVAVPSKDLQHSLKSDVHLSVPNTARAPLSQVHQHVVERVVTHVKRKTKQAQFEKDVRSLRRYVTRRNARALAANNPYRRYMRRLSKGSSAYELALLSAMLKIPDDDGQMERLGYNGDILAHFISDREGELQAYLNIATIIESHIGFADVQELAGAYETIVLTTHSTLSALAASIRRFGVDKMDDWVVFLSRATVADLISQPPGGDKIHLMHILQELKTFRTLNTIQSFLKKLKETRLRHISIGESLTTFLNMVEQPISGMGILEKWVAACTCEEQILFFQDFRNVFSKISPEAYKNEDQRQDVRSVLQNKIDFLIYNSDE